MDRCKHILITGATGLLGGHLVHRLLRRTPHVLLCLARARKGEDADTRVRDRLAAIGPLDQGDASRLIVLEGDLREAGLGLRKPLPHRVDEVWHLAAVLDFETQRERQTIAVNHGGLVRVLDFMERQGIPRINFTSTAYVAGSRQGRIPDTWIEHVAPANNPYEQSKRLCEAEIVQRHATTGLAYRLLRPSIIVGHSRTLEAEAYSGLYGYLAVLLRLKEGIELKMPEYFKFNPLKILIHPDATVNLICVDHVAELVMRLCGREDTLNQVFHLTNPHPTSIAKYIPLIGEEIGITTVPETDETRLGPVDDLLEREERIFASYLRTAQDFECTRTYELSGLNASRMRLDVDAQRRITRNVKRKFDNETRVQRARLKSLTHTLESRVLRRDDLADLTYYVGGEGAPLVILNAYGQSLAFWDQAVSLLLERFRILIWPMRGTASQRGGVDEMYPLGIHVEDVQRILEREGVKGGLGVAWCTGPKIALCFQNRYPGYLRGLVSVGGCFKGVPRLAALETDYERDMEQICSRVDGNPELTPFVIETLRGFLAGRPRTSTHPMLRDRRTQRDLVHDVIGLIREDVKGMVIEPFLTTQSALNYGRQLLDFWSRDVEAEVEGLTIPTLFITGTEDNIAACAMSEAVSTMSSRATCATVRGGSHYLQFDSAALLVEMIDAFAANPDAFVFEHSLVTVRPPVASLLIRAGSHPPRR